MANTYTLIASNTLTTSAASVTFSSIPSTYTDLLIKVSMRNGAATNNYADTIMSGDPNISLTTLSGSGSAAASSGLGTGNDAKYGMGNPNGATSSTFSNAEMYIPNYASTDKKQGSVFGVTENNGAAAYISIQAMLLDSTSAISSLTFYPYNGNFATSSSFFLYGIKNS